jgi:hypothetical protein
MATSFTRRILTLPRLVRVLAAASCALTLVSSGAAYAQVKPDLVLPTHDPFYVYTGSTPLSQIAPGTVLKERSVTLKISSLTVPYTAEQVLYRTTGQLGQPTVSVTTIIQPVESPLGEIVSYQSFYDALGSECDPSYTLRGGNPSDTDAQAEAAIIATYVTDGYTVNVPDFEGSLTLDWGAGQQSGYETLDSIRATESYLNVPASTKVGMLGYSGGSIATEWASELAPAYAPELNIIGAASGGVPVDYAQNLTYINGDDDWAGVIPAVLVSLVGRAFGVHIDHYLSAYGLKIVKQVSDECIGSFASDYPGLTYQQLLKPQYQDIFQIRTFVLIMNKEIMGSAPGHPEVPVLLGVGNSDGTGDGIMVAGDVEALAYEYCHQGVPVTFDEYTGLDHTQAAVPFMADAATFLTNLFAGDAPGNNCSSVGKGTSIAPLPVPPPK